MRDKRVFSDTQADLSALSVYLGPFYVPTPIGAVSVIKAVYVDKRELKCACVGGDSNVPLGFLSLTENVMMVAMALWMTIAPAGLSMPH
jgi:hypothetical protein